MLVTWLYRCNVQSVFLMDLVWVSLKCLIQVKVTISLILLVYFVIFCSWEVQYKKNLLFKLQLVQEAMNELQPMTAELLL